MTNPEIREISIKLKSVSSDDILVDECMEELQALITKETKAYGGCTLCYGKGYATVSDRWIGYDTDTDIGSPGGVVKGGSDFAMKYCTCDRGKQLEGLVTKENNKARVDEHNLVFTKTGELDTAELAFWSAERLEKFNVIEK